jgi:hypothetical protein
VTGLNGTAEQGIGITGANGREGVIELTLEATAPFPDRRHRR